MNKTSHQLLLLFGQNKLLIYTCLCTLPIALCSSADMENIVLEYEGIFHTIIKEEIKKKNYPCTNTLYKMARKTQSSLYSSKDISIRTIQNDLVSMFTTLLFCHEELNRFAKPPTLLTSTTLSEWMTPDNKRISKTLFSRTHIQTNPKGKAEHLSRLLAGVISRTVGWTSTEYTDSDQNFVYFAKPDIENLANIVRSPSFVSILTNQLEDIATINKDTELIKSHKIPHYGVAGLSPMPFLLALGSLFIITALYAIIFLPTPLNHVVCAFIMMILVSLRYTTVNIVNALESTLCYEETAHEQENYPLFLARSISNALIMANNVSMA